MALYHCFNSHFDGHALEHKFIRSLDIDRHYFCYHASLVLIQIKNGVYCSSIELFSVHQAS
jgi:hypothetical protein